jgi:hypothetical protein
MYCNLSNNVIYILFLSFFSFSCSCKLYILFFFQSSKNSITINLTRKLALEEGETPLMSAAKHLCITIFVGDSIPFHLYMFVYVTIVPLLN